MISGLRFLKGHGTENDFVLLPDPDGTLELTPELVRRLCDRRAGLGGDGVLRVVPTAFVPEVEQLAADARWFMDHRNADGTTAQMCGNGLRVFTRYLVAAGYASTGPQRIATRRGVLDVELATPDGLVTVDMGPAVVGEPTDVDGVLAPTVDMGNPHAVVPVASLAALGELKTTRLHLNVEYVEVTGPAALSMRVHERGVGETRSCGTGACAAVVASSLMHGVARDTPWQVRVPGGELVATWRADGHVLLSGPAVLVAEGTVSWAWVNEQ